jgi:hypothetical protein
MPELFADQKAEPPRPDWLADDAVKGQTCLGGKKQGKIQGNSESGWKSRALASLEPMFRAFLPIRRQRITGKAICDNRAMHRQKQGKLRPSWNSVNTRALPFAREGRTGNPHTNRNGSADQETARVPVS